MFSALKEAKDTIKRVWATRAKKSSGHLTVRERSAEFHKVRKLPK